MVDFSMKSLWKIKVPLKIKVLMWYLNHGVILTKHNLAKRGWRDAENVVL